MRTKLLRVGDELAVKIPAAIASHFGWKAGDVVEVERIDDRLIITPQGATADIEAINRRVVDRHQKLLKKLAKL